MFQFLFLLEIIHFSIAIFNAAKSHPFLFENTFNVLFFFLFVGNESFLDINGVFTEVVMRLANRTQRLFDFFVKPRVTNFKSFGFVVMGNIFFYYC